MATGAPAILTDGRVRFTVKCNPPFLQEAICQA